MSAKRTRQRTVVTLGVTFELPPGCSMEYARKRLTTILFNELRDEDSFKFDNQSLKVKALERHVRYTERGTSTPDS